MCSYEDRIRAVRLYLKMGKRIRATIRHLGQPARLLVPTVVCDDYRL